MGRYTDLLYTTPTFLEGVGRLIDFGGALDMYNESKSPNEADRAAIASDWWAIGDDMRESIRQFARENGIELSNGK